MECCPNKKKEKETVHKSSFAHYSVKHISTQSLMSLKWITSPFTMTIDTLYAFHIPDDLTPCSLVCVLLILVLSRMNFGKFLERLMIWMLFHINALKFCGQIKRQQPTKHKIGRLSFGIFTFLLFFFCLKFLFKGFDICAPIHLDDHLNDWFTQQIKCFREKNNNMHGQHKQQLLKNRNVFVCERMGIEYLCKSYSSQDFFFSNSMLPRKVKKWFRSYTYNTRRWKKNELIMVKIAHGLNNNKKKKKIGKCANWQKGQEEMQLYQTIGQVK